MLLTNNVMTSDQDMTAGSGILVEKLLYTYIKTAGGVCR